MNLFRFCFCGQRARGASGHALYGYGRAAASQRRLLLLLLLRKARFNRMLALHSDETPTVTACSCLPVQCLHQALTRGPSGHVVFLITKICFIFIFIDAPVSTRDRRQLPVRCNGNRLPCQRPERRHVWQRWCWRWRWIRRGGACVCIPALRACASWPRRLRLQSPLQQTRHKTESRIKLTTSASHACRLSQPIPPPPAGNCQWPPGGPLAIFGPSLLPHFGSDSAAACAFCSSTRR